MFSLNKPGHCGRIGSFCSPHVSQFNVNSQQDKFLICLVKLCSQFLFDHRDQKRLMIVGFTVILFVVLNES